MVIANEHALHESSGASRRGRAYEDLESPEAAEAFIEKYFGRNAAKISKWFNRMLLDLPKAKTAKKQTKRLTQHQFNRYLGILRDMRRETMRLLDLLPSDDSNPTTKVNELAVGYLDRLERSVRRGVPLGLVAIEPALVALCNSLTTIEHEIEGPFKPTKPPRNRDRRAREIKKDETERLLIFLLRLNNRPTPKAMAALECLGRNRFFTRPKAAADRCRWWERKLAKLPRTTVDSIATQIGLVPE